MNDNHMEDLLKENRKKGRSPYLLNTLTKVILGKMMSRICFNMLQKKKNPEIRLAVSDHCWGWMISIRKGLLSSSAYVNFTFFLLFLFLDMWNLPLENKSINYGSISQKATHMHQLSPSISRSEPMESGAESSGSPNTLFPQDRTVLESDLGAVGVDSPADRR